jgi:hypothetical protein
VQIGSRFKACIREVVGLNPGLHIENRAVFSGFTNPSREILHSHLLPGLPQFIIHCHPVIKCVRKIAKSDY